MQVARRKKGKIKSQAADLWKSLEVREAFSHGAILRLAKRHVCDYRGNTIRMGGVWRVYRSNSWVVICPAKSGYLLFYSFRAQQFIWAHEKIMRTSERVL